MRLPDRAGDDWQQELRATAASLRALAVAHPAAVSVFLTRPLFTPAGLRTADAVIGLFRRAGLSPRKAVLAYQLVVRSLLTVLAAETNVDATTVAERRTRARAIRTTLRDLPRDRYPHLVEAAAHIATPADPARTFAASLDVLIAGLSHLISRDPDGHRP
jgi:hypothetical protein